MSCAKENLNKRPFVVNIVGERSNVGKTTLIEGLIKELVKRGYKVGTIKHDIHGFDIDKEGKDTYKHRVAGASTVIISSKNRMAMIKEVNEEEKLENLIKLLNDKDFIIVEGYKKSNLKKIEVFRKGVSSRIITPNDKLICVATDIPLNLNKIKEIKYNDYKMLIDLLENLKYNQIERS